MNTRKRDENRTESTVGRTVNRTTTGLHQGPTPAELQRALFGKVGKRYLDLETQLVYSVIEYLSLVLGLRAFRRNVGAREWIDGNGKTRIVKFGEPGQSDVWAIGPDGLHIEIELKRPGEVPRPNQEAWLNEVQKAGGIALAATTLPECAEKLKQEFERKGIRWQSGWDL